MYQPSGEKEQYAHQSLCCASAALPRTEGGCWTPVRQLLTLLTWKKRQRWGLGRRTPERKKKGAQLGCFVTRRLHTRHSMDRKLRMYHSIQMFILQAVRHWILHALRCTAHRRFSLPIVRAPVTNTSACTSCSCGRRMACLWQPHRYQALCSKYSVSRHYPTSMVCVRRSSKHMSPCSDTSEHQTFKANI